MAEAPEGLRYLPGLLSEEEERALSEELSRLPYQEVRMHGVAARRTVVHYGWDYGYESWKITPTEPVPGLLDIVRARCAADETYALELAPRSGYVLAGAARSVWQHMIPPVNALRYSLSFWTVRSKR